MAQVFTHNGEGFVLRGKDVLVDRLTTEPHLTRNQARTLVEEALRIYKETTKHDPVTVAIHKTTRFSKDEEDGIRDATGELSADFVTITKDHDFRFVRDGNYPVLRGTIVFLADQRCLLYTTGYTPRMRT